MMRSRLTCMILGLVYLRFSGRLVVLNGRLVWNRSPGSWSFGNFTFWTTTISSNPNSGQHSNTQRPQEPRTFEANGIGKHLKTISKRLMLYPLGKSLQTIKRRSYSKPAGICSVCNCYYACGNMSNRYYGRLETSFAVIYFCRGRYKLSQSSHATYLLIL